MMENTSREEVLQMAEEEDVEFVRLQFTDMFGTLKNIAITARELPRALNNEIMVDGSYIAGISHRQNDLYLYPDPDTFTILPWRPQQGKVARMLCDLYTTDGKPYSTSSRYILQKQIKKAQAEGYVCYADPECEFFLFHTDDNGAPTMVTHERAEYLDMSPLDLGENARRDMVLTLEDMGLEVESSHHEKAPAQHEITFKYSEIGKSADNIITFKNAVRIIAKRHGLHATFMPKPRTGFPGSGMHLNLTLYKRGRNVFASHEEKGELSEEALYFIGGLIAHSREMALITNPLVNSYKRLVEGYDAPTELTWTKSYHNSLIRIPTNHKGDTRIELRAPDPSANPYLVCAVCLAAGMDGIEKRILPPLPEEKRDREQPAERMPQNLMEAIELFENSDWIREVLGDEFCRKYLTAKKDEWNRYAREVSDWEITEYLNRI